VTAFLTDTLLPCVIAPLALLALLAFAKPATRIEAVALTLAVLAGLATLAASALWLVFGLWLPLLYALAALVLALRVGRRTRRAPWVGRALGERVRTFTTVAVTLAFVGVAAWSQQGRLAGDRPTLALEFPLRDGTFLVANGGTSTLLNAHVATLEGERFRAWRGQSYGYDLVRVDALGRRSRTPWPRALEDYASFGTPVYAPCAGRVLETVNDQPDRVPPARDVERLPGNFVLLECGDAWVVLAHLRQGSVAVAPNAPVRIGDRLGEIGNSGNTSEPHLHLHAQRPGPLESAFAAEPLLVTFDGRALGRNAVLRRRPGASP
jgi:hypothetical protein